MQDTIRVLLGDGHRCTLWGLKTLIDAEKPRMEVATTAWRPADVLAGVRKHQPDIVLLELDIDGQSGLQLIGPVRDYSAAKIIIFTGVRDTDLHEQAILAGAQGLVLKSEPAELVVRAIERVHAGELWLKRQLTARLIARMTAARPRTRREGDWLSGANLTRTEMRVIEAAVKYKGAPNKVIAETLRISSHTLRNHLSAIYTKLGIHRRLDLILYGMEHGMDCRGGTEVIRIAPAELPTGSLQVRSVPARTVRFGSRHEALEMPTRSTT